MCVPPLRRSYTGLAEKTRTKFDSSLRASAVKGWAGKPLRLRSLHEPFGGTICNMPSGVAPAGVWSSRRTCDILASMPDVDVQASLAALAELGGTCDCTITFDVTATEQRRA